MEPFVESNIRKGYGMIAVLMCVYINDRLNHLKEAVESIFSQSYKDYDLFIMADGPVKEDIDAYLSGIRNDHLIYLKRAENKGLAHTLNELIDLALNDGKYKYFARMDADDISHVQRFAKQVEFLQQNQNVDLVGTWCEEIDEQGILLYKKRLPVTDLDIRSILVKRNPFVHTSVMMRRKIFEKDFRYHTGYYLTEDYHLWIKLAIGGFIFHNIPDYLVISRIDNAFYHRRGGYKKAFSEFKCKSIYIKNMKCHYITNYFFALISASVKLFPPKLKKICYLKFR